MQGVKLVFYPVAACSIIDNLHRCKGSRAYLFNLCVLCEYDVKSNIHWNFDQ